MVDNPPHREVSINPDQLGDIGARLETEAIGFTDKAAGLLAALANTSDTDGDPAVPHRPYAADPRNEPAQPVVERHETAVEAARELLKSLGSGMTMLGRAASAIGRELADRDAALAVDVDRTGHDADRPGVRE